MTFSEPPRKTHLEGRSAEVDAALEAWARWAKSALSGIGWPSLTLLCRVIELGAIGAAHRGATTPQADELCELVDRIVMRLPQIERKVLVRHYLHWEPGEVSARHLSMSFGRFRVVLHRARKSVGDRLDGAAVALQQNTH